MAKKILIACGMQQDEIEKKIREFGVHIPVVYMGRGMHENPGDLHSILQQEIDRHQDCDEILMTYGLCGLSTEGLYSEHTRLILPRFHDCIHQLMENQVDITFLYMTRCWTLDEKSILKQCEKVIEEYGTEMGSEILQSIYGSYEQIAVIDTDSYDMEPVIENAKKAADLLNLSVQKIPSKAHIIEKLLLGTWDEDFIVLQPGEFVKKEMFMI
ncbi:MAG: DUF1638 domain-containing protein [Roseburia sp.]